MSCPIIAGVLTITAIGFAMAQVSETTKPPGPPLVSETSCQALNKFNDLSLMRAKEFTKNLAACEKTEPNENRTLETTVLVDYLYRKLKLEELANLTMYPEIMNRISNCVGKETGFNFSVNAASNHFGLPNLVSFKFGISECNSSLKLSQCVEDVYSSGSVLNATTKSHKNVYMRLFDGIHLFCEGSWVPEDKNNSHYSLPSFTLIVGSAIMVFKLFYCNAF